MNGITTQLVRLLKYGSMLLLMVIILLPMLYLAFGSFKPREEMFTYPPTLFPQRWTTGNYETLLFYPGIQKTELQALRDQGKVHRDILYTEDRSARLSGTTYARVYGNILLIIAFSSVGVMLIGGVAGYAFAKIRFPMREALFVLVLSTTMIPRMIVLLPQYLLFRGLGLVGTLVPMFAPELFFGLMNGGFLIFFFRQHFKTVPDAIVESAKIDGARHLRIVLSLMFPLSKPILVSAFFFTLVMKWNDILPAMVYLLRPVQFIPVQVAFHMTRSIGNENDPLATGLVMAASMLAITPFLIVFFFGQRYFIQGITQGAVKS
jgi:ABC-type glycerol-3-phosphate transport system permease component